MSSFDALLVQDLHLAFADWGRPVTFRQVTSQFDPARQQVTETQTETLLPALRQECAQHGTQATAQGQRERECRFLVRFADLPEDPVGVTSRIIDDGVEYAIIGSVRSPDGLTVQLDCRRR